MAARVVTAVRAVRRTAGVFTADMADAAEPSALVSAVEGELGPVEVLIASAGINYPPDRLGDPARGRPTLGPRRPERCARRAHGPSTKARFARETTSASIEYHEPQSGKSIERWPRTGKHAAAALASMSSPASRAAGPL